ncbi:juvenile hormone acid O-methyltransferase-like isoform X1 [Pectinophora gossypiella]|uniref:juvenile hormone acid O-methyltransferase-like isoform X1 n=1 Tax=Pectinophora gossypiella TaxID=13191 RepID=UPI00214E9E37|nr:juvenile hormone acid O-methyltransferase-like isoform X1 [Pectinophora gossypiella]
MDNVELYHYSNKVQKRDAFRCLEEFGKKIKWRNFDKVLDIGCGDGGVTTGILKKFIPDNFKHLVGCDISHRMVEFANRHYGDERTSFMVMDIEGQIPRDLRGAFDHTFSFYTLHWIVDQEAAFTNIYELLGPDGDCLLVFLGNTPLFDVFRILSRRPKWRPYLKDVERFVSPYHDSQDPEKEIRRMMAKIGFKNIDVQCKEMCFVYKTMDDVKSRDCDPESGGGEVDYGHEEVWSILHKEPPRHTQTRLHEAN